MNDLDAIRAIIARQELFYLAGHTGPDGDAVGACFGLGLALEKMGKTARVLLEDFHHRYRVIPGRHLLYTGAVETDAVVICLDCGDAGRVGKLPWEKLPQTALTVNIDHHYTNPGFARYNYVDPTASSTCEMVYRLLEGFAEIDAAIAAALYAGMVGDTGGFRFNATAPSTLRAAGELTAIGIPFTQIYTELVHLRSVAEVKLLAKVLDSFYRSADGCIVCAAVTRAMMAEAGASSKDLEGVAEFLLNIRDTEVAVLLYDCKETDVKVSLRSRALNIGAVASALGGGGHHLAAGATVQGEIFAVRDRVLRLVEEARA